MAYQISLSDQEYAVLATEAEKSGEQLEQLLHKMILRLQPHEQRKPPTTMQELIEQQYLDGKITHIPTREPLTQEELEVRRELAQRFGGGKPASEMIIEDRGSY